MNYYLIDLIGSEDMVQKLVRAFISKRLEDFTNGILSTVRECNDTLKAEIDLYLRHYEPLTDYELE